MLRRIYNWCIDAAHKPYALWIMGAVSFAESSFFPVPPDVMLIPMSLARPERAWLYAAVCTATSVLGGLLGYAIGALLYDSIGHWLIEFYGLGGKVEAFRASYAEWGALIIMRQGPDADPLQAGDHHVGFCRLQYRAVRGVLDPGPRRTFLRGRDPAQPLRRMDPGQDREAFGAVGGAGRRCTGAGFYCRSQNDLKQRRSALPVCRFRLRSMSCLIDPAT
jgi:membrane protein YqaA with SNARE-associated domain